MNRSAELQLRQNKCARNSALAPSWSSALQFRGSWSQGLRKRERAAF